MRPKQLVIGTLVGALTLSATGYVIFGIAFPEFFTNFMNAEPATNVERPPLLWAVALAMLSYGLLMTLAVGSDARPLTLRTIGSALSDRRAVTSGASRGPSPVGNSQFRSSIA